MCGQYFRPVLMKNGRTTIYNRNINKKYQFAKLTEHSWWLNPICNYVAKQLYCERGRLAWVGDYAEDSELKELGMNKNMKQVWDSKGTGITLDEEQFTFSLDNKFLCNHDKRLYVNLNEYRKISNSSKSILGKDWILHPLSLLTAVGNGRGGGDYYDSYYPCLDLVGTWAWDSISIEDKAPEGYEKLDLCFMELTSEAIEKMTKLHKYVNKEALAEVVGTKGAI